MTEFIGKSGSTGVIELTVVSTTPELELPSGLLSPSCKWQEVDGVEDFSGHVSVVNKALPKLYALLDENGIPAFPRIAPYLTFQLVSHKAREQGEVAFPAYVIARDTTPSVALAGVLWPLALALDVVARIAGCCAREVFHLIAKYSGVYDEYVAHSIKRAGLEEWGTLNASIAERGVVVVSVVDLETKTPEEVVGLLKDPTAYWGGIIFFSFDFALDCVLGAAKNGFRTTSLAYYVSEGESIEKGMAALMASLGEKARAFMKEGFEIEMLEFEARQLERETSYKGLLDRIATEKALLGNAGHDDVRGVVDGIVASLYEVLY